MQLISSLPKLWLDKQTSVKYNPWHWFGQIQQKRTLVLNFN